VALERGNREKFVERIANIAALRGRGIARNPEEPSESHDVVDAKPPGMAHIRVETFDEGAVGGVAKRMRGERRQAPVLALQVEGIRGRTGGNSLGYQALFSPGFGAVSIDTEREVAVKSDGHTDLRACAFG
jgi:hypothetical protein